MRRWIVYLKQGGCHERLSLFQGLVLVCVGVLLGISVFTDRFVYSDILPDRRDVSQTDRPIAEKICLAENSKRENGCRAEKFGY